MAQPLQTAPSATDEQLISSTVTQEIRLHQSREKKEPQKLKNKHLKDCGHGCKIVDYVSLLNVPVFCFLEHIQRWQRLAPNNVDRIVPESEPGEMEIYIHHPHDHFDVVSV